MDVGCVEQWGEVKLSFDEGSEKLSDTTEPGGRSATVAKTSVEGFGWSFLDSAMDDGGCVWSDKSRGRGTAGDVE